MKMVYGKRFMKRKKSREWIGFVTCICILAGLGFAVRAESNPISITASAVKNQTFTVVISAAAETDMQAFKYIVGYDGDKVSVVGKKGAAYSFSDSFLRSYNADASAILAYNNVEKAQDSHLIFAGAQTNAENALLPENTELCFIKFQFIDSSINSVDQAGIYLKVEQLKGTGGDLVNDFPEEFAEVRLTGQETQYVEDDGSEENELQSGTARQKDNMNNTGNVKKGKRLTETLGISEDGSAGNENKFQNADPDNQADVTGSAWKMQTDMPLPEDSQSALEVSGSSQDSKDMKNPGSVTESAGGEQDKTVENKRYDSSIKTGSNNNVSWLFVFTGLAAAGTIAGYAVRKKYKEKNSRKP